MIAATWASAEISMDYANAFALNALGGKSLQDELPVSLRPKIAFFRKAHNRLPALAGLKEAGLALATRMTALRDKRHDAIHGFAATNMPDGSRNITRMVFEGAWLSSKVTNYSLLELLELSEACTDLASDLTDHVSAIAELRHNHLG